MLPTERRPWRCHSKSVTHLCSYKCVDWLLWLAVARIHSLALDRGYRAYSSIWRIVDASGTWIRPCSSSRRIHWRKPHSFYLLPTLLWECFFVEMSYTWCLHLNGWILAHRAWRFQHGYYQILELMDGGWWYLVSRLSCPGAHHWSFVSSCMWRWGWGWTAERYLAHAEWSRGSSTVWSMVHASQRFRINFAFLIK